MSHFLKGMSADKFNQQYPVGSRFNYFFVKGIPDSVEVVTRTEAWALGHGGVVVSVNGRAGGLSIEHMKPVVMDKHIDELKKAALAANLHGWAGFEDELNTDGYSEAVSKFIGHCSPSAILELLANLEAAEKLNPLAVNVSELEATYIGDIRLHMAAISDWKQRAEAAEARLLVPVKLPADEIGEAASFMSAAEVIPVSIVIARIKAAGYQVEGGVDNDH